MPTFGAKDEHNRRQGQTRSVLEVNAFGAGDEDELTCLVKETNAFGVGDEPLARSRAPPSFLVQNFGNTTRVLTVNITTPTQKLSGKFANYGRPDQQKQEIFLMWPNRNFPNYSSL